MDSRIPMSISKYRCLRCGHKFERKQGFTLTSKVRCPKCNGKAKRIIFPTPTIPKGGD